MVTDIIESDNAEEITFDMPGGNQTDEAGIGKPAVHQQVIEPDAFPDGGLHHLDSLIGLFHLIVVDTLFYSLSLMVFREPGPALLRCKPLYLLCILLLFSMEGEIKHQLTHAVREQQRKTLATKHTLMPDIGVYTADELGFPACLRGIGIIYNQADRLVTGRRGLPADLPEQLKVHRIKQPAPPDIAIIHKTIEHVLLTHENPAK